MGTWTKKPKRDTFQDLMTILGVAAQGYGAWNQGQQFQQGRADTAAEAAAGRAHDLRVLDKERQHQGERDSASALHDLTIRDFERDPSAAPQYRAPELRGQQSQFTGDPDADLRSPIARSSPGFTPDPSRLSTEGQERLGMWSRPSAQELATQETEEALRLYGGKRDIDIENQMPMTPYQEAEIGLMGAQTAGLRRDPLELYKGKRIIDQEYPSMTDQAAMIRASGGASGGVGGGELTSPQIKWAETRVRAIYPAFNLKPDEASMLPEEHRPTPESMQAAAEMYDGLLFGQQGVEEEMVGNEIEGLAQEIFAGEPEALVARAGMTDFEGFLVDKLVAELRRQAMSTGMNEWHDVIGGGDAAGAMVTGAYDMGNDQLDYLEGRMRSGAATFDEQAEFERLTRQAREVEQLQKQRRAQEIWRIKMPGLGDG